MRSNPPTRQHADLQALAGLKQAYSETGDTRLLYATFRLARLIIADIAARVTRERAA